MSNESNNDRRVVFRRIGGRVVPIAIGGGLIGAGVKVGSDKTFFRAQNKIFTSKTKASKYRYSNDIYNTFTKRMSKTYKTALKKADVSEVIASHPRVFSRGDSLLTAFDPVDRTTSKYIHMRSKSRFSFLHELGHAVI